jgi:excisionase family DNA binding protein
MIGNDTPILEREFLSYREFASIIGVTHTTICRWVKKGYLRAARFSPRYVMIPRSELDRYRRGEMMEPHGET